MRLLFLLMNLICFSANAMVDISQCTGANGDVGKAIRLSMIEDFNIDKKTIISEKTLVEILLAEHPDYPLALFYGNQEKKLDGINSDDPTTADEYARGFMMNRAKNFIIRYTFEDNQKRHNILIASAFISNTDCIVRFNGYIIVKREF